MNTTFSTHNWISEGSDLMLVENSVGQSARGVLPTFLRDYRDCFRSENLAKKFPDAAIFSRRNVVAFTSSDRVNSSVPPLTT